MIRILFNEPDSKEWKRWRRDCSNETSKLCQKVIQGDKPDIKKLYKRRVIKLSVYMSIDGPFHGKCAYCEALISADQPGDIEHFRPARAVTDEDGNPVTYEDESGNILPHPGYYWLAYNWRNLLPACDKCNSPNSINGTVSGKFVKFPLRGGSHAISPGDEVKEEPLLINPMFEDPEDHIEIDFKTSFLAGDERGMSCIRIFGLNTRPGITQMRIMAYEAALTVLNKYNLSVDEAEEKDCLRRLCDIVAGKTPYSFIARSLIKRKYPVFFEDLRQKVLSGE